MSDRIAIIGISGSGKSRLARELGARSGLPVVQMDALFWSGSWRPVPEAEYLAAHECLIESERWIIEGYVDAAMAGRLRRADQVIFLDPPGWLCAWRVIRRWLEHRRSARPELSPEALERFQLRFLWTVTTRAERPAILAALEGVDPTKIVRRG
ncbi:hypothetical protein [Phenylobacterium sp.]|uniref:hypothetical protein n=2 Tax=unclassified Phenylobacterium TaxID=2640670 RepID=UPI0035B0426C|nr:hypothetical protein [Pseudomonadota bacterium]